MKVIDISDYSENLEWNAISQKEDGVIVKISEGRTPASLFTSHMDDIHTFGMPWGVYCVSHATNTERAVDEADVVIDMLNDIGTPPLYIWYDIEPFLSDELSAEDLTAIASAFVVECNENGYDCGIYGNYTSLNKLNTNELDTYVPYWAAEPGNSHCYFKDENPHLNVKMWQYEFDNNDYGGVVDKNIWWSEDE
nr:MAG TPA: PlyB like endolysin [Caudoviricetes sp.]